MYSGIPFSPQVALADSIGEGDTIIKVTDISAFPDAPNYATIGTDEQGETILYAAKTTDSLSGCTRGIEGAAKPWPAGTTIARNFTNKDFGAMQENIRAAQTAADEAKKESLSKSGGTMTGPINMAGQPISGLNPPTEEAEAANKGYVDTAKAEAISHANAVARTAAPRNLLDNSDFTNLVNQRGQTSYTGDFIYTIDRWQSGDGAPTLSTQSDGVKLYSGGRNSVPYIFQRLEKLRAGTYTFAAKFHDNTGTVELTCNATDWLGYPPPISTDERGVLLISFATTEDTDSNLSYFRVQSANIESSAVWEWAALYEGEYNAETLPEYRPKGYAAELAECQRYYRRFNAASSIYGNLVLNGFVSSGASSIICPAPDSSSMRISKPTATFNGVIVIRGISGYETDSGASGYESPNVDSYGTSNSMCTSIRFQKQDASAWGLTNNTVVSIQCSSGSSLELSADL